MTKQEFLSELERALGKLPHAEVEQAIAFYDEAINDRMEDGLSENDAVADLGQIDEIAAQITAEIPPIPRAIARANTGSRILNIVLLAVFSPIWVPVALALAAAALAVYVAIWAVIASLLILDAALVLMPFAGLGTLATLAGSGTPLPGIFVLGLSMVASGLGLIASFAVFWASRLLFQATRTFARWIASLFVRVNGSGRNTGDAHGNPDSNGTQARRGPKNPLDNESAHSTTGSFDTSSHAPISEEGARNA